MFFKQYYLGCLSHASYLIGDTTTGQAVVVDPQRDIAEYLADADTNGLAITKVIETHFHADFLSGHLELAARTGASIVYGAVAAGRVGFPIETHGHGDRISLGNVDLEILETPGHTPESICVVVRPDGPDGQPYGVLTGDTLFIGDVGRPDLLAAVGFTADDLARQLYESLHTKLMVLPDDTKVFPAHGAGSACGKNLSTETVSTIGEQRRTNYALAPMVVEDFVDVVTQGQTPAPLYFLYAATRNREAHALLPEHVDVTPLSIDKVREHQNGGAIVIDSRDDNMFASAHLRGSINVGLSGRFAEYVGEVMEPGTPIIIVAEPGSESEARTRLARIGFDNVVGALDNPYAVFIENPGLVDRLSRLSVEALAERMGSVKNLVVIDVRNHGEFALGHLPGAKHVPLSDLLRGLSSLDPNAPTVVNCAGGYRSSIASSLLRSHGFTDVSDLIGGYTAWANSNIPVSLPTIDVMTAHEDVTSVRLDCREIDEWESGHDPQARHIPMSELPAHLDVLDKSRRIIVVCRSGNRSGKVTAWLTGLGYDAVNMVGGMQAWSAAGLPVVDDAGAVGAVI
ncbi:MAG: Beta-lactamase hydrolase-like protein [Actinomycetota bacterium]|jgi:rhodanese-related sulfurtransferase/glyoxylase-like metal-dependent hydrolase (beta-lactamase superfamily II)